MESVKKLYSVFRSDVNLTNFTLLVTLFILSVFSLQVRGLVIPILLYENIGDKFYPEIYRETKLLKSVRFSGSEHV